VRCGPPYHHVTRDERRVQRGNRKGWEVMSGVIDDNGQQWERCNGCVAFVEIETLAYEQPSEEFEYGRDLCENCVFDLNRGLHHRMEIRKNLNVAEMNRIREQMTERVEVMACGHSQRHGSGVYRFKDIPTGNPNIQESRCRIYCSEACADKDPIESWVV
jgi:hypothetical protein